MPRPLPTRLAPLLYGALLLGALLAPAGGCSRGLDPTLAAALAELDGHARLGRDVLPTAYRLALEVDPRSPELRGRVEISVDVAIPTTHVTLHAEGLEITGAWRVAEDGGRTELARVGGRNGALSLVPPEPLEPEPATLLLEYRGRLGDDPNGAYRLQHDGAWYAFTQFQPLAARRAFPCFDDPGFKTPFELSLSVPEGMRAFANTPELSQRPGKPGMRRFGFAASPPLPTYLVAFAVGPLDSLDIDGDPARRILTVRDRGLQEFAAGHTGPLLGWLEEYFARPYPYAKLDQVGVPNFAMGAMENVGLVTYRESRLLLDGERSTRGERLGAAGTMAHELAHMWFGNLVTLPWWDELWLNEAFASWLAAKTVDAVAPDLEAGLHELHGSRWVMGIDAGREARPVRVPIESAGDVFNAFSAITYTKGSAVLRMTEAWLGEERFREGVRRYIDAHAHGHGSTQALLAALGEASGEDVAGMLGSFVDQPGTPLVELELECPDPAAPGRLRLRQQRYRIAGSRTPEGGRWKVPVCLRYGKGRAVHGGCFLLEEEVGELALETPGCPDWLHPNRDEDGYYVWSLPELQVLELAEAGAAQLGLRERLALPSAVWRLVDGGQLEAGALLKAAPPIAADPSSQVVAALPAALGNLEPAAAAAGLRPRLGAWSAALFAPQLDRLAVEPIPDEPEADRELRLAIVSLLAELVQEPRITAEAERLRAELREGSDEADPERLRLLLRPALRQGGEEDWQAALDAVRSAATPGLRRAFVGGLGAFEDPVLLARSLDLVLEGSLRGQDYRTLAGAVRREQVPVLLDWIEAHYPALVAAVGEFAAPSIAAVGGRICDQQTLTRYLAVFARSDLAPGSADRVAEAEDGARSCIARSARLGPQLAEALP